MYAYVFYIKVEVRAQQGPRETGESEKTDSLRIITDKNTHTHAHSETDPGTACGGGERQFVCDPLSKERSSPGSIAQTV